eukprot:3896147-Heterocapsa_arctica.AAC.1
MGNRLVYSWGQIMGRAACEPVSCGFPKMMPHAMHAQAEVKYPNYVNYDCDNGYTLDQTPTGPTSQNIKCQWTATFEEVKECLPVTCGECPRGPAKYNNSEVEEVVDIMHYGQKCHYNCDLGYTFDQRADGDNDFALTCMAQGEFEEPPSCKPVLCGSSPTVQFSKRQGEYQENRQFVYKDVVAY